MIRTYAGVLALSIVVGVSAACGSGDSSHDTQSQPTPSAGSASAGSPSPSSAAPDSTAAFCAHIVPAGGHPGDAFAAFELYDPSAARREAKEEAALMKGAVPPAAIAQDWKLWKAAVQAVLRATADPKATAEDLDSAYPAVKKAGAVEDRLTDYAFAHCA